MISRSLGVFLVAVALVAVSGCNGEPSADPSPPSSSPFPTPVEGRVPNACEHVAHHEVLRPFIGDGEEDFPNDAARDDESNNCMLYRKVAKPVKGSLVFKLDVKVIEPDDESPDYGKPNLSTCYGGADCWLGGPKDCTLNKKPADEDFRNFVAQARALPYEVRIDVGVWPENFKRDLCKADKWSEAMAQEFLETSLAYLLTGK